MHGLLYFVYIHTYPVHIFILFQTAELALFTLKKVTIPDHIVSSRMGIKFRWKLRYQEAELYWSRGETSLALHLMEKLICELVCM